ncbi:hypothetical protein TorRG33x02_142830 [Trema orientale]|uniref:Uncharacterized protein n=1 Tax=Trema orientale TaxID=63057 RepID=A0A2P5EWS8_TREOI|nr:hypothetical protein TorRG33x02_142830 [Trema orientale]
MEWDFIDEDNDIDMVQRVWEQSCITLPLVLVPNPQNKDQGGSSLKELGFTRDPKYRSSPNPHPEGELGSKKRRRLTAATAQTLILCARLLLFPEASLALSDHVGPACRVKNAAAADADAVTAEAKYFSA